MSSTIFSTPLGNLLIEEGDDCITTIQFTEEPLTRNSGSTINQAVRELTEYFTGERKEFTFRTKPNGTAFQQKVWVELEKIPFGSTITYQELANRLGDPKCIRAAAAANGRNPIAIVIPCHRVIGSDGSMTGYASGIERKKALLRLEGADVMKQINLFQ